MVSNKIPGKTFFFVGISFKLFWFLLLAKLFNWRIYVFDVSNRSFQFTLLQKMHNRQWLTRVVEQHHAFYSSHSDAIELSNRVIDTSSGDSAIQLACKLCKSTEVDLVFKRALVQHLSLLTSINQYIVNNKEVSKPILFINRKYNRIIQENPEILDTYIAINYSLNSGKIKLWLSWIVVVLGYFLHLLVQLFYKENTPKKKFKLAISIPFKWAGKFKGAREFTFLVDDEIVKKDEVVFLVEYSETKEFYQYYSDSGYTLREALGIRRISDLFKRSTLKVNHDFYKIIKLLTTSKKDFFVFEALISLLIYRLSWSVIVEKYPFKNYIYFNKEGKSQIATNIFLKERGIVTHAYSQFIGGPYQVCGNDSIFDQCNIHYSFLNPDYYYLNNKAMADSMELHCQDMAQHKVVGNIFSEKIIEINNEAAYIENLKAQYHIKEAQKVISIFDTSYIPVDKHYSNYDEAKCFLKDMIGLVKSLPDCMFLFKPSKDDTFFLNTYWSDESGSEIVYLRHEFNLLENAIMLSNTTDVIDVISVSDIVLTNSFSSPTTDALLAEIPAFWYQAKTDVSFSVYRKIPNLVVNGYESLTVQIDKILRDVNIINLNDPDFIHLIGDTNEKALTALRRNFINA